MKKYLMAIGVRDDIEMVMGDMILKYLAQSCSLIYVITNEMKCAFSWIDSDEREKSRKVAMEEEMTICITEEEDATREFLGTVPFYMPYSQRHYIGWKFNRAEVDYVSTRPDFMPDALPSIVTAYEPADSYLIRGFSLWRMDRSTVEFPKNAFSGRKIIKIYFCFQSMSRRHFMNNNFMKAA